MYDPDDVCKVIDKDRFKIDSETGEVVNLEEVLEESRSKVKVWYKDNIILINHKNICTIKYRFNFG